MTWNGHIEFVTRRSRYRLTQLKQIVSRYRWQWRGMAVWRLYQATVQPILELYAIFYCDALNFKSDNNAICNIWKSALKLATGAPIKGFAVIKLQKLLHARHPYHCFVRKLVQFYLKCQVAPVNTYAARVWQFYQAYQHTAWIACTPLGRAAARMHHIEAVVHALPADPTVPLRPPARRVHHHQVSGYGFLPHANTPNLPTLQRRPPPAYIVPYPHFINDTPILQDKILRVYTDGSSDPNPGRSAAAWIVYPTIGLRITYAALLHERTITIPYPCAINIAELYAICNFIEYIYEQSMHQLVVWPENSTVLITSDSENCIKMFTNEFYPKAAQYYWMLQAAFLHINDLYWDFGVQFHFQHVKAHQHGSSDVRHACNNIVDQKVKQACKNYTAPLNLNGSYYEYYFTNNNAYIDAYYAHLLTLQCKEHKSTLSDHNALLEIDSSKHMLSEMRLLNLNESRLINLMRGGYTADFVWYEQPRMYCTCPGLPKLTTAHLLYECPVNLAQRETLRMEYNRIEPKFHDDHVWNDMKNVLFPHVMYSHQDLKSKPNLLRRYELLKALYEFCRHRWPD